MQLLTLIDTLTKELDGVLEAPRREVQLLCMAHLDVDELYLMMHADKEIALESQHYLQSATERLKKRVPLEYITNRVSFYSEEFYIDEGALIPRPETEHLLDKIFKRVEKDAEVNFVEVGVGSGIISIMLAKEYKNATFKAIDISKKALSVAQKNLEKFHLQERVELIEGSFLEPIADSYKIDILVSNPPYIANSAELDKNLSYEPQNALFGGEIGDEMVKVLLDEVHRRGIKFFACEFGYDQRVKVESYLQNRAYKNLEFYKDYADFDRGFIYEL